jgi:hypothetical protein
VEPEDIGAVRVVSRRVMRTLEAEEALMAKQIVIMLRGGLDDYHQRRANKHGYIYLATRRDGYYNAKSVATGAICTLLSRFVEEAHDGQEAA